MGSHRPNPELNSLDDIIDRLIEVRDKIAPLGGSHDVRIHIGSGEYLAVHDIGFIPPDADAEEPEDDENKVIIWLEGNW